MDLSSILGKPLAFVMIREVEDGDDEWVVLTTAVIRVEGGFALDMGPDRPPVPFPEGLEEQIRETPDSLRPLLEEVDYFIGFLAKDLGSGEAHELAISLGFQWPGSEGVS